MPILSHHKLSGVLASGLLAVLFGGCQSVGEPPPHFEGELNPVDTPTKVLFDPVGHYTFQIRSNSTSEYAFERIEFEGVVGQLEVEPISVELLIEGSASVTREESTYRYETSFHSFSMELFSGEEHRPPYRWIGPPFHGTFKASHTGEPFNVEFDPASTLPLHQDGGEEMEIDLSASQPMSYLVSILQGERVLEEGDKVRIPAERYKSVAIRTQELEGEPEFSGDVFWVVKGTTNLRGRLHAVGEYLGELNFHSAEYEGSAKVGGYSLIDLSTGMEVVWERLTTVNVDTGSLAQRTVETESGRIEATTASGHVE